MQRLRRIGITVLAMVVVLALTAGYRLLNAHGVFNSVSETAPGLCRAVEGTGAVADIASDGKAAYVAADKGLFVYDGAALKKLSGTPKQFAVRAMALSRLGNEVFLRTILVEGAGRYAVALFHVKGDGVEELGRVSTDMLSDPVALAAPDMQRFYVVNRSDSQTGIGRWLDNTLLLPRTHLLWFDGMKFVAVADHLNTPSGLAVSADNSHLYIAEDYPRSLVGMARNEFSGAIDGPSALTLSAGPHKITVAANGDLIVAAEPKPGMGEVFRVRLEDGLPKTAEKIYASRSHAVSAAVALNGHLVVGTRQLLDCR